MSGGKAPAPPPPSAEERALQAEQAELLRLQRQLLGEQQEEAKLLEPIILRQSGLEKVFTQDPNAGVTTANLQNELATQKGNLAALRTRDGSPAQLAAEKRVREIEAQLAKGPGGTYELHEIPGVAEQRKRQQEIEEQRSGVESLSLKRQEAALKGELPIDAGLLKDLSSREDLTRERLLRNLGPGFETSTAGANALREFETFRGSTLDQARRGDIQGLSPLSFGGSERFGYRAPETYSGLNSQFSGAYGSLAGGYGQAAGQLANQRQNQFQQQLQSSQSGGGSAAGGILGVLGGAAAGLAAIPTGGSSLALYAGALGGGIAGGLSGYRAF